MQSLKATHAYNRRLHNGVRISMCAPPLADASLDRRLQNACTRVPAEARRCAPVALENFRLACLGDGRAYAAHHAVPGELVD